MHTSHKNKIMITMEDTYQISKQNQQVLHVSGQLGYMVCCKLLSEPPAMQIFDMVSSFQVSVDEIFPESTLLHGFGGVC